MVIPSSDTKAGIMSFNPAAFVSIESEVQYFLHRRSEVARPVSYAPAMPFSLTALTVRCRSVVCRVVSKSINILEDQSEIAEKEMKRLAALIFCPPPLYRALSTNCRSISFTAFSSADAALLITST